MGLEQVTKILLDQAFPRLTPPQYDILLNALCDDKGCRFPRGRWYLTGSGRSGYRAFGWFSDHNSPDLEAPRRPGAANGLMGWLKAFNYENNIGNRIVYNIERRYHPKKRADGSPDRGRAGETA
jgi:hypothetical protein